ncbi:MAG TPA: hypothetical protein VGP48_13840 [Stellaceae bacterium]|jgi:hypothetical protein|nr:hypothetical protein [Stellaceae bacterium]
MKAGVIAVMLAGSVSVAQAATCYRSDEIEADQAVRFQTQLMVLSDSCGSTSYTQFTHRNASTLAAYQEKMIGYFRRISGRGADSAFDRFITSLANKTALDAGREPIAALCTRSADFLTKAEGFDREGFMHYVVEQAAAQRGNYQTCKD